MNPFFSQFTLLELDSVAALLGWNRPQSPFLLNVSALPIILQLQFRNYMPQDATRWLEPSVKISTVWRIANCEI
jgi:hypothetical protein